MLVFLALAAPLIVPYDPNAQVLAARLQSPSLAHLMGTDNLGRDILSRIIYGGRTSLSIGIATMVIVTLLGASVGITAGYLGGILDLLFMRAVDVLISLPLFLLLITVSSIYGSSLLLLIIFIGILSWPSTARIVRSEVLSIKQREFVEASRALGASNLHIMVKHIFPNVLPLIVVSAPLQIASAILIESSLSYFGLGVPVPIATWGNMITDGKLYVARAWWMTVFPGSAIVITVFAFNLIGEGFRNALEIGEPVSF